MRADSPGHSAKYGCYSVMHVETNIIIDLQLVQVSVGILYKRNARLSVILFEDKRKEKCEPNDTL